MKGPPMETRTLACESNPPHGADGRPNVGRSAEKRSTHLRSSVTRLTSRIAGPSAKRLGPAHVVVRGQPRNQSHSNTPSPRSGMLGLLNMARAPHTHFRRRNHSRYTQKGLWRLWLQTIHSPSRHIRGKCTVERGHSPAGPRQDTVERIWNAHSGLGSR